MLKNMKEIEMVASISKRLHGNFASIATTDASLQQDHWLRDNAESTAHISPN